MSMDKATENHLLSQLVKLGDMMGDGLHLEPDGKWISTEYKRILRALGYKIPRANNSEAINKGMAEALKQKRCDRCDGQLKQTRSGSMRAECIDCGAKYQFKRAKSKKAA